MKKLKYSIYEFEQDDNKISLKIDYNTKHYEVYLDEKKLFNGHVGTELAKHKTTANLILEALEFLGSVK